MIAGRLSLVAVGLLAIAWPVAGAPVTKPATRVDPGDELFAVDPRVVTELSVVAPDWRLTALRWNPKDPFVLIFSNRKDRAVRTCKAGAAFQRALTALTTLKARRVLTAEEGARLRAAQTRPLLRLTVADSSQLEAAQWELALPEKGGAPVGFSADLPQGAELDLERAQLDRLAQGCRVLGEAAPGGKER
jgi:hypothetical protein